MASYNPSSQAGMPQDPAPYPPAGAQQPYTGTYRPQTAAPAVQQRQAQPWQAETARWNPNGAAPRADVDPKVPPLALDGYCPVTLSAKEQWAKGDPRYGVIHRGRTYLFAGPEEAKRFFADPDHYAPVLSGMDVVIAVEENRQVPGRREYGAWYEGRVFLFAGDASYRKFDQDPTRYAAAAAQGNTITARRPADRRNGPPYSPDPAYPQYPPPARY